jgi:hypothetical protein
MIKKDYVQNKILYSRYWQTRMRAVQRQKQEFLYLQSAWQSPDSLELLSVKKAAETMFTSTNWAIRSPVAVFQTSAIGIPSKTLRKLEKNAKTPLSHKAQCLICPLATGSHW